MPGLFKEDFWEYVDKSGDCWIWVGIWNTAAKKDTYGKCSPKWGSQYAHRASWILTHGEIPDGFNVLHRCNNKPCVRPGHLYLGTDVDNRRDLDRTGWLNACGEVMSKLTRKRVESIFSLRRRGLKHEEIASRFGVVPSTVSRILSGKRWARALGESRG